MNVTVKQVLSNPELQTLTSIIVLGMNPLGDIFAAMSGPSSKDLIPELERYLAEAKTWNIVERADL